MPFSSAWVDAQRPEHAVVDRVVEEEDLGGLDDDRHQRQQAVGDEEVHAFACGVREGLHDRPDREQSEDGHDHAEDAGAEVVDQHLEAGAGPLLEDSVDLLEDPGGQRPDDHRAEEHRDVRPDHDAHRRHRADDRAALAVDEASAGVADEDGQEGQDHRPDQRRQLLVRQPARRDEQGGDQAPRDERGDVGHDHAGQEATDPLDRGLHAGPLSVLEISCRGCHWVPLSHS